MASVATRLGIEVMTNTNHKATLTPTGLLMEGEYTQYKKAPTFAVG